jgi:hypothetical protein
MNTPIQTPVEDRSAIRLQNAYSYVAEYFPELPESSRILLADCMVKAFFPVQTDPDFQKQADRRIPWASNTVQIHICRLNRF